MNEQKKAWKKMATLRYKENPTYLAFSNNLIKIRSTLKLRQEGLASFLGIPRGRLINLERLSTEPMMDDYVRLADLLEVSIDQFLRGDIDVALTKLKEESDGCRVCKIRFGGTEIKSKSLNL
jgi:transcriptional regulator with XRE-family HTH domain